MWTRFEVGGVMSLGGNNPVLVANLNGHSVYDIDSYLVD